MRVGIGTNNVAITDNGVVFIYVSIWETVHFIAIACLSAVLMTGKVATSFATTATDVTISHADTMYSMQ